MKRYLERNIVDWPEALIAIALLAAMVVIGLRGVRG